MMKKLLVFILVLGMASAASAALSLQVCPTAEGDYYDPVDTQLVLFPSDYLWIGVHNDTDYSQVPGTGQGLFFLAIDVTGEPPVHNGSWTGNWMQFKPPLVAGAPDNVHPGTEEDVFEDGSLLLDLWVLELQDGNPEHFQGIGILDAKEFHCEKEGDVTVVLFDDSFGILDTIVIHQIPEPATIALLGLGGLLLRRRK